MRPSTSEDDSWVAAQILVRFVGDEPWMLQELVPGGVTFHDVQIATDGSAVLFDVYAESGWTMTTRPLGKILIQLRSSEPEAAIGANIDRMRTASHGAGYVRGNSRCATPDGRPDYVEACTAPDRCGPNSMAAR